MPALGLPVVPAPLPNPVLPAEPAVELPKPDPVELPYPGLVPEWLRLLLLLLKSLLRPDPDDEFM